MTVPLTHDQLTKRLDYSADILLERIAARFTVSDTLPAAFLALARAIEHDDDDARFNAIGDLRALLDWPRLAEEER